MYKIVAIIPARGGSKRIPDKNIKLYGGKPLIYWSIKLASKSRYINEIVVTTDSKKIADIARFYGAKIVMRPKEISDDLSTDLEFMDHYLNSINKIQKSDIFVKPDILIHLRPTYPNRDVKILDSCIEKFIKHYKEYDSLRTVCENDKPAYKMYRIDNDTLIPLFQKVGDIEEPYNKATQMLPKTYWHNGYIDITKPETITIKKSVSGTNIYPYIMDKTYIHDIDTIEEWEQSEKFLLK